MYCENCGAQLPDGTAVCTACGVIQDTDAQAVPQVAATTGEPKIKMAAGLLAIFLGWLGVHYYYLGDMPPLVFAELSRALLLAQFLKLWESY